MLRITFTLAFCATSYLCAQPAPQFEVAAIKPAPPQPGGQISTQISANTDRGLLTYTNISLKQMVAVAYKMPSFLISGPDSLETDRFDVIAKFEPTPRSDDIPLMVQALLAERFHLKLHRETREMPVYALSVAQDGPKFKSTEKTDDTNTNSSRTEVHLVARISMARFAEYLTNQVSRPVVDKTGLAGWYELKLDWARDSAVPPENGDALPSIFTALSEQLGLKLQSTRAAVETIVVDSVDRAPTEN